jgi:hypothetical protein
MDTKSLIFIYAQASYLARTRQLYSSANRAKAPSSHYCKVSKFLIPLPSFSGSFECALASKEQLKELVEFYLILLLCEKFGLL